MSNNEKELSKSIIIDGEVHGRFKVFCRGKNLKIGKVVEDLIKLFMKDSKQTQKLIDELKEKE
jgi:hypothetical protein